MITYASPQVALVDVGNEFGTCFALNSTVIMTAGHVGQAVGDAATIWIGATMETFGSFTVPVGGVELHGVVSYIAPGAPPGGAGGETAAQVPNDYALISVAPQHALAPVHIGTVQNGSAVTEIGYPGLSYVSPAATIQTTQIHGLSVTNEPLAQGGSGGPVYNAQGEVVGIMDAFGGGYDYVCDFGMNVEIAALGVMMGWQPSTIASMEARLA